jgi:HK97 family phage prohead protease
MESQLIKRTINPEIRAIDADKRTIDFVISTERVDSYGTVFKIDGWELDAYRTNPVVAYNHHVLGPDPDLIIGTSDVRVEDGQLVATLSLEEGNSVADKVLRKLKNGTLRGASIGAVIHEGRYGKRDIGEDPDTIYFTRMSLVEWSVVSIPSNPDALKRSASEELVINSIPKPTEEKNSRADSRDEIRARISILQLN